MTKRVPLFDRASLEALAMAGPGADHETEVFRIRVVKKKSGKGVVVLCQFPGGPEFVQQFFRIMIHTEEDEPGTIDMSRPKSAVKKYGMMDRDGEIIRASEAQEEKP